MDFKPWYYGSYVLRFIGVTFLNKSQWILLDLFGISRYVLIDVSLMMYMSGDSPFIASPMWRHVHHVYPLVSTFHNAGSHCSIKNV